MWTVRNMTPVIYLCMLVFMYVSISYLLTKYCVRISTYLNGSNEKVEMESCKKGNHCTNKQFVSYINCGDIAQW